MDKIRRILLILLLILGICLMAALFIRKVHTAYDSTLAPAYQLLGLGTQSLSRSLTRMIPVDSLDEKEYGKAITEKLSEGQDTNSRDYRYLNELIGNMTKNKQKPFDYRIFLVRDESPNAMALPGGVILVTEGLLSNLKSESELVSVLYHEMGHIELSHAFDRVRFQLLSEKIGNESAGWLADFAFHDLIGFSYSKTEEDAADEYAFHKITATDYDPYSLAKAFRSLQEYYTKEGIEESKKARIFRDYYSSHPPLKLRMEKYSEEAGFWCDFHPGMDVYTGTANLKKRVTFFTVNYGEKEWHLCVKTDLEKE
jgi:beta-barrel assembly-enhancing protease